MAENDGQDRTEAPTPKRREDAREKGQVPRSQELTTAALLLGAALILNAALPGVGAAIVSTFGYALGAAGTASFDSVSAVALLQTIGWKALLATGAVVSSMAAVALAVAGVQARGVLTSKPLAPNWEKLSPLKNAKRLLGAQPWAELFKSLLKLTIVGLVVYKALGAAWPELVSLGQYSPAALLDVVRRYALRMLTMAGMAYLALALADYLYQIWQHEKGLRMSKQEIKQEMKQNEGDPLLKARMRSFGRQLARRQMFRDVPKADVVVTNPTHIAVALRYDPTQAAAPIVLAMGQRKVAERIKAIAREAGVPTVENKPLARALLANAHVGATIPAELYVAVAEVLAFVIRQRTRYEGHA